MAKSINQFNGVYRFLSNFYASPVMYEGREYPTAEHAFQAAKAEIDADHDYVASAPTPAEAKRRGKQITLRLDWDAVRLEVMEQILRCKFAPGTALANSLDKTGEVLLIEGNYWGDTFWGVCRSVGTNHLGKILMKIRVENRAIAS